MDNGLVTSDGTKVLTVVEYDQFVNFIPMKFRPIFEVNTITGLLYVEIQRLHDHEEWYYTERNQIILPKEAQRQIRALEESLRKAPNLSEFSHRQARSEELEKHNQTLKGELEEAKRDKEDLKAT